MGEVAEHQGHNVAPMRQGAVVQYGGRSLTAADIRAQVNLIQDVMGSVMKDGTHYGQIPGTQSKSLYKPGAEKIMATFRLVADPVVEDLGQDGEVHYRVKVWLYAQDGTKLGAGLGECSSQEEKYAWRKANSPSEWEHTPENRRRVKYANGRNGPYEVNQIRTNPADVRNTILKMAKKRGLVDAVLTVTAASDCFTQDIEDLPPEVAAEVAENARSYQSPGEQAAANARPPDSQERTDAIAAADKVAEKGTAAFKDWWAGLDIPTRNLIRDQMQRFRTAAEAADKQAPEEATTTENDHA